MDVLDVFIGAKMGEQIANEHADLTCRRYEQTLRTDVTDRQTNFNLYNIDSQNFRNPSLPLNSDIINGCSLRENSFDYQMSHYVQSFVWFGFLIQQ